MSSEPLGFTGSVAGVFGCRGGKGLGEIAARGFAGAGGIHKGVISAVAGCGTWDLTFVTRYEFHGFAYERDDVGTFQIALKQEVITRTAAHRTPIHDLVGPDGMVAQESGGEMLHGVEGLRRERRLAVGAGHADVESRDGVARGCNIAATHVDARLEPGMVDGKACYLFHNRLGISMTDVRVGRRRCAVV